MRATRTIIFSLDPATLDAEMKRVLDDVQNSKDTKKGKVVDFGRMIDNDKLVGMVVVDEEI